MLKTCKYAQAVAFDLVIALLLFTLFFVVMVTILNNNRINFEQQFDYDLMQREAFLLSETLVKTQGIPQNWHSLEIDSINSIGLAERPLQLSTEKVARLKQFFVEDYNKIKTLFKIPQYEIFIQLNSSDVSTTDLNFGPHFSEGLRVTIRRIVDYNGSEATFDVSLTKKLH